jgi:hypothetical protein
MKAHNCSQNTTEHNFECFDGYVMKVIHWFDGHSYGTKFPVNYCPFCGAKLSKERL